MAWCFAAFWTLCAIGWCCVERSTATHWYTLFIAAWSDRELLEAAVGSAAARDVIAERQWQQTHLDYSPEHDDAYADGELADAAAAYCGPYPLMWPWSPDIFKPRDRRTDLVRAGALVLAEIERLDRAAGQRSKLSDLLAQE